MRCRVSSRSVLERGYLRAETNLVTTTHLLQSTSSSRSTPSLWHLLVFTAAALIRASLSEPALVASLSEPALVCLHCARACVCLLGQLDRPLTNEHIQLFHYTMVICFTIHCRKTAMVTDVDAITNVLSGITVA